MSCCGERDKPEKISSTHKWGYMNLKDFRSSGCITPVSYGILYISFLISIACYVIDAFTAAQLLVFDRWSGQIEPAIPFSISRWIFAGCIILSWVLLAYRWFRALRAIRSEGVAQSYLDPLAVRVQSIRMGKNGQGWRRFLVFAELTKSKKGAEYVALFTYFSFEAWMRIIFAEGPRNVINGITIYTVAHTDLVPIGQNSGAKGSNPIIQFFINVKIYADGNSIRAAILFGMVFVCFIWLLAALSLAASCILYILFLWHHIPDKGLRAYCKRKVDTRLQKIIDVKVQKAIEKEDKERSKIDLNGRKSIADIKQQPTLPILDGDQLPIMPLARQGTQNSFDSFQMGNAQFGQQPTLPDFNNLGSKPMFSPRVAPKPSLTSMDSYSSNAPLIGGASPMGDAPPRSYSPAPSYRTEQSRPYTPGARMPFQEPSRPGPPSRQNTGMTYHSQQGGPLSRQNTGMTNNSQPGPPRSASAVSNRSDGRYTPAGPPRQFTPMGNTSGNSRGPPALGGRQPTLPILDTFSPAPGGRHTPVQEFEMRSKTPQSSNGRQGPGGFRAYSPAMNSAVSGGRTPAEGFSSQTSRPAPGRSFTSPAPQAYGAAQGNGLTSPPPRHASPARNFSAPNRPLQGYSTNSSNSTSSNNLVPPRSGTAPASSNVSSMYVESIYDAYGTSGDEESVAYVPQRSHTASPGWK